MSLGWTRNPVRFFQHLLREADAKDLDIRHLVGEIKSAGAGGCIVMGGGFSAWYPTVLTSQTVNPHLNFDFLGEMIDAAKQEGIRVIVRMDISKGRKGMEDIHPDWFVRREDGSISSVWAMPQMCATGPFWQEEVFSILDEIIGRCPRLDGFFFNYLHVPRCHCARCLARVLEATGKTVPPAGIRSPKYERWREAFLADYMGRVRDFIHARHDGAALVPYHHVHDGWDIRRMADISDIIGSQVSNPVMPNPVDPQPMWNFWAAEEALTARALKPDSAPVLIQTSSEVFASRQSAMPDARLMHNLIQAAAHGANTAPAVNGLLSQSDNRFVPALQRFGVYQRKTEQWYRGLTSLAKIAIVKSEDSRLWGADAGRPAGAADGRGHVSEFRGFFEMVADLRYPLDVVVAGGLTAKSLSRYDVVILPAVESISDGDAAAIDAYVSSGGHVIATGDTGRADENGSERAVAALACLAALPGKSRDVSGAYFELDCSNMRAPFGDIPHIAAAGDFWSPSAEGATGQKLHLIGPFQNNAPEFTVVEGPGTVPGLIRRTFGQGFSTWLPWRVGSLYHRFSMPEYCDLLGVMLENTAGPAPLATSASSAVETILYEHNNGLVLHVLNGAAARGKGLTELTPLAGFDIAVTTQADVSISLEGEIEVASSRVGDRLIIHIERLDSFAAFALLSRNEQPLYDNPLSPD
ncbi:alpha-amylase family protein [Rhizobium sp. GR12]|uniref:alpha-amylase family protein n=1 Tax=Rhizobium sp. GR12 TaxID=3053925 RepID=UPI002FBDEE69